MDITCKHCHKKIKNIKKIRKAYVTDLEADICYNIDNEYFHEYCYIVKKCLCKNFD